jgi:hypothetical protein
LTARPGVIARLVVVLSAAAIFASGCTYDYLQRSDRVAYNAGDAVKANLAQQTTDPGKRSRRVVKGLGQNGYINPAPSAAPPALVP